MFLRNSSAEGVVFRKSCAEGVVFTKSSAEGVVFTNFDRRRRCFYEFRPPKALFLRISSAEGVVFTDSSAEGVVFTNFVRRRRCVSNFTATELYRHYAVLKYMAKPAKYSEIIVYEVGTITFRRRTNYFAVGRLRRRTPSASRLRR